MRSVANMGLDLRISPREPPSPISTRAPSQAPPPSQSAPEPPPQDMELDIPPSPPPIEATLAERRAKRQAILAKYAGASQSQIPSPSVRAGQGTSSAVHQPPQSIVPVSDPASSQPRSVIRTPGVLQVNTAKLSSGLTSQSFCLIFGHG